MPRLEGKIALVTGAADGNGREIALGYAREGADIALADVNTERLAESTAMVETLGRKALAVECDVAKPEQLDALVARTKSDLGGLDIAVANAGIVETDTDCMRMTEEMEGNPMLKGFLTDRIPNGGFGEPDDISALATFMASDESKYMNGSIVPVDGGLVAGLYSGAAMQMLSKR